MTEFLRRIVYFCVRPAWRLVLRLIPVDDPWERLEYAVPTRRYGLGAKHDFDWYFEGESSVKVSSLREIQDWLIDCRYIHDAELFREADFWQHPITFERLRQGDCEDHALWAWRKLVELGFDADFVAGRCLPWDPADETKDHGHAWVVVTIDGRRQLFEAVAKTHESMLQPLADVASGYRPEFGVDRHRKRFTFNGILLTMRDREFGVRTPTIRATSLGSSERS